MRQIIRCSVIGQLIIAVRNFVGAFKPSFYLEIRLNVTSKTQKDHHCNKFLQSAQQCSRSE